MAKKASILDENYNPVGSRLQKIVSREAEETDAEGASSSSFVRISPILAQEETASIPPSINEPSSDQAARDDSQLLESRAMTSELRCRCTKDERKKWHQFAMRMTGEANQFSHMFRAFLILLEHSEKEIEKLKPMFDDLEAPPKGNPLATVLYEQKVAELLWEGFRKAGKPRL